MRGFEPQCMFLYRSRHKKHDRCTQQWTLPIKLHPLDICFSIDQDITNYFYVYASNSLFWEHFQVYTIVAKKTNNFEEAKIKIVEMWGFKPWYMVLCQSRHKKHHRRTQRWTLPIKLHPLYIWFKDNFINILITCKFARENKYY